MFRECSGCVVKILSILLSRFLSRLADDGAFRWLQTTRDTKFTEEDIENYEPFLSVRVGEHRLQGTALGFGKLNA